MARGKGVYKRGGVWWIRYAGPDGRIRFESCRSCNYKEAEVILIQKRKEVQEGKDPVAFKKIGNHMFKELAEHYHAWSERQRCFRTKKGFIKQLLAAYANYPLRRFTTQLIEEYQSKSSTAGKSPATVNRHLTTLKHMFTKAVEWEMVEEEILKKVRRVKLLQENNRRLRYLSTQECQALVNASEPHLKPIIVIALHTGMRKEEILSLEWDRNVDLVHGFILLEMTKNGERREVPINATLRGALKGIVRRVDSPYVFVDREGRRFKDVRRSFHSALRKVGLKDFRFHDLRHTFASQLVMAGVDITTVKELLGHKSLAMTLRYSHLAPAHKVNALSILDGAMNRQPTIQKLYNPGCEHQVVVAK